VTSIGRGINSQAKEKHRIKQADRLLSNRHLQQESFSIYTALSRFVLGSNKSPVILIDWSDLDEYKRHFLIRATLASQGRGICLYEEVHTLKTKEKPEIHRLFLSRLASLLPKNCNPIIVTDAGFKTPWFRAVLELGWNFVGRTRLPNFYSVDQENWQCVKNLYKKATARPQSLSGYIARRNPLACQLISYRQKSKGRHAFNRSGSPKQSKASLTHRKSAKDPWLLSTSLPQSADLAKRVVKIYRLRMQIEESFRDLKSRRYGQGFEYNKTIDTRRLSILILLSTLAHWMLMLLGMMAKLEDRHRCYQANSIKTNNVLSLPFIGRRLALDRSYKPDLAKYFVAIKTLQNISIGLVYEAL